MTDFPGEPNLQIGSSANGNFFLGNLVFARLDLYLHGSVSFFRIQPIAPIFSLIFSMLNVRHNCFKILLFCCALPAFSCSNNREAATRQGKAYFTILDATVETWQAGRQDGGSGTDYRFATFIQTDKELQFDSVWIAEKSLRLPLTVGRLHGPVSSKPVRFSKGDTVLLVASFSSLEAAPKTTPAPEEFKGDALISFQADGKKQYETIPVITKKEGLPRPAINSNNQ